MSAVRRPEPTEDELRNAWLHCRRDTWPETFEEAMEHPTLSRLVRITAMHPPRAQRKQQVTFTSGSRDFLPREAQGRRYQAVAAPREPIFDRKRAAAGDRDDD